jgi:cysteine synthase A
MKGYKVQIYLQDGTSHERAQMMRAFGAKVTRISNVPEIQEQLKATNNDFVAATNVLKQHLRDAQKAGKGIFFVDQMLNPLNAQAHHDTTGKEIWEDTDGNIAALVASVGTGGTIRGVSDYLKEKNPSIKVIAVEPAADDKVLTGIHNFTDVPEERVPINIKSKRELYDEFFIAPSDSATEAARKLAETDAVLTGFSSGAALWGALQIAKRPEFDGKNIVVVFPDTGLRYLSQNLFE